MSLRGQLITASGTWTPPAGVTSILVTGTAGGGGGGSCPDPSISFPTTGAGGGGAGEYCVRVPLLVVPEVAIAVTIGAAGAPVAYTRGTQGGTSSFGTQISLIGGWGGSDGASNYPHTGASAGSGGDGGAGGGGNHTTGQPGGLGGQGAVDIEARHGGVGRPSLSEFYGGSAGGGGHSNANSLDSGHGGSCNGYLGGVGSLKVLYLGSNYGAGGGGGASFFGPGGAGGFMVSGNSVSSAGYPAPAGSYGAAGGGAPGWFTATPRPLGGAGRNGAFLVQWMEP